MEARAPGVDRARRALLLASAGGFLGFYLELAAVPAVAAERGGDAAPGIVTAALMLSTVVTQAAVPALLRRWSASALLIGGLWLLGVPALLYAVAPGLAGLVAVTLVRGVGFGLMTVVGSLLVARYAAEGARGRAIGLYGLVSSSSGAIAPAIGVAVALHVSPTLAFVLGAVPPVAAAVGLAGRLPPAGVEAEGAGPVRSLGRYASPVLLFVPASAAFGGIYSYLPLLGSGSASWLLVVFGVCFSAARLVPGHLVDHGMRVGVVGAALVPLAVAGMVLCALDLSPLLLASGAALAGTGIGGLCTATLVMMIDRGGVRRQAQAAAVWNIAYDAGTGVGGLVLAVVAANLGIAAVFAACAAALVAISVPAAVAGADPRRARLASER